MNILAFYFKIFKIKFTYEIKYLLLVFLGVWLIFFPFIIYEGSEAEKSLWGSADIAQ